jgi:TatD DNase family protein
MLTDAHCHPFDLLEHLPESEAERRRCGVACAASAWNLEQFEYHEGLAKQAEVDGAPPVLLCFAIHPQLPAYLMKEELGVRSEELGGRSEELLGLMGGLAAGGRLAAVGETGFDLFDVGFKATEKIQDELFVVHLETALKYGLPLVLHVRKAMHKVFVHTKALKRLPAVIFHSWPGTVEDGESLLRRGVNAYFSFGSVIAKNHKEAIKSCAAFPLDNLLLETDAPYQPLRCAPPERGKKFSSWEDVKVICQTAAELRGLRAEEIETAAERNFFRAFKTK